MASQTFYLKYRPQKISELDNLQVAEKLSAYLKTGKVPHAFLLVGHKGTGKTSSARIIAKAINCEDNIFAKSEDKKRKTEDGSQKTVKKGYGESYEPCNKCELCRLITEGNNPDVLEIDAASNTSVEDVRDLRDKIRFSPSISRFKVYIIDEVHMISKSAFNALLKTLEEPPEKTVFILATTELEKVPDTIVSRCTLIEFKRADFDSIKQSIGRIVKGEKLKITPDATDYIVGVSSGSFRDAAKILEQATYLSEGKEITKEIVEKITGGESEDEAYELLNFLVVVTTLGLSLPNNSIKSAIQLIEDLKKKGVDLRAFVKTTLETLHKILLVKVGIESSELRIGNMAEKIEPERLKIIIEKFEKAYQEMKFADVVELPVEMAILEILSNTNKNEDTNTRKQEDKDKNIRVDPLEIRVDQSVGKKDDDDMWKKLICRVNSESKQLAGIMRSCKFVQQSENVYEIETSSKFHFDRLNDGKAKDLIDKCALEIVGKNVKIDFVLIEK